MQTDLQDVDLSQIVSAKLLIQLKNPTKKSPEEVKKAFSAVLKPVSDLDNISFKTRRGASVTGSQLEKSLRWLKLILPKPVSSTNKHYYNKIFIK